MSFIGVVLAGGQSSRMGNDKALLKVHGQTMLERSETLLYQSGAKQVKVSRNLKGTEYLPDIYTERGPLGGIHAAAVTYPNNDILFLPVDLPLLTAGTLKLLVRASQQYCISSRFEAQNLPLYLKVNCEITRLLQNTLAEGTDHSVYKFCQQIPLHDVVNNHPNRLLNTNTTEQWRCASQMINISKENFYGPQ